MMKLARATAAGAVCLAFWAGPVEAVDGEKATGRWAENFKSAEEYKEYMAKILPLVLTMPEIPGFEAPKRAPMAEEIKALGKLWPSVAPEENAATYFAKAAKALAPEEKCAAGSSLARKERPYAGDVAEFESWVKANEPAMELMREGFKHEFCQPLLLITAERGLPVADRSSLQGVAKLARVCLDAGFLAEQQGRGADAAEAYCDCLRLGMALRQHGTLGEDLVGVVITKWGTQRVKELVAKGGSDEETLEKVMGRLREAEVKTSEPTMVWMRQFALVEAAAATEKDPKVAPILEEIRKGWAELMRMVEGKTLAQLLDRSTERALEGSEPAKEDVVAALKRGMGRSMTRSFQEMGKMQVMVLEAEICTAKAQYAAARKGVAPKSVKELVPKYLPEAPRNPMTGAEME